MTKTSSSTVTVEGYKTETPVISLNENTGVITGTGNGYVQLFIVDNVWYELSNPYQIPDSEIGIQHAYAACATENGKQQSDYVYQNIQWDGVPSETTVQITIAEMVSEFGWTNSTDNVKDTDWTIKGVTFRFEKGTGSTTPKYYSTGGGAIRFYAHNIMTITAGGSSIIQVKFTNNGNYKFVTGDCSDASYSEDGSYQIFDFNPGVTSVVINNSTSAQRRPNYFEVTFS